MNKFHSYLFAFLFLSMVVDAQNNIDLNSLPEVVDIIEVRSNPSADTVIIALHGGPTDMLYSGDFDFLEGISTFSTVEMKQYQHLHDVVSNTNLTLEEAIIMNDTTVAMLQKTINHFKDDNKTVVIMGHSFGAFLINEYVDDYGLDNVHRAVSMSGRINMNQEIVDAFATGIFGEFESDGVTTTFEPMQSDPEFLAAMKLQAGVGYNRWIDSLGNDDLTKFMVVYGENDEAVGRLLPDEIAMLNNGNARVLGIAGGSHDAPFDLVNMNEVLDFIREEAVVSTDDFLASADIKMYPTVVEDYLNVNTEKEGQIFIANMNGQILFSKKCGQGNHEISLQNLPSGLYVAHFRTKDNEMAVQKIVRN